MTLVRYNPLNDFVPATFGDFIENALKTTNGNTAGFRPAVDIIRDDKQLEIQLIAPGMKKEDFKIDLENNLLNISGERVLNEDLKDKLVRKESGYGKFKRTFTISDEINTEKISASYADGILFVRLPLVEQKVNKSVIKVK